VTSNRKDVRIKRSTADKLLEGLTERALQINKDPYYLYKVSRLVVFGSYVNDPEMDTLGDLDIGFLLEPKHSGQMQESLERKRSKSAPGYLDWMTAMFWSQEEVLRRLRNRSAYISLHRIGGPEDEAIFSKSVMEIPLSVKARKLAKKNGDCPLMKRRSFDGEKMVYENVPLVEF